MWDTFITTSVTLIHLHHALVPDLLLWQWISKATIPLGVFSFILLFLNERGVFSKWAPLIRFYITCKRWCLYKIYLDSGVNFCGNNFFLWYLFLRIVEKPQKSQKKTLRQLKINSPVELNNWCIDVQGSVLRFKASFAIWWREKRKVLRLSGKPYGIACYPG